MDFDTSIFRHALFSGDFLHGAMLSVGLA
ncbi:MAG: hypothetical protein QOI42_1316, partial [Frankiaceae bacterium]|nr:hypothetical protein [Frankiaceae bacterium]